MQLINCLDQKERKIMNELDIFSKINDILDKSTPDNYPIIKEKIMKMENEKRNASKWLL